MIGNTLYQRMLFRNETVVVEFVQTKDTLVYKDGRPADRDCWLYLPFMCKYSKRFQPPSKNGGYVYRRLLAEVEGVLEIKTNQNTVQIVNLTKDKKIRSADSIRILQKAKTS